MAMKPYSSMPLKECGEPMIPIPRNTFAFTEPHPYVALGAPYGGANPWMLRKSVIEALERVQARLHAKHPGWKIMLFDAYRPNAVQAFMVENEYKLLARADGLDYAKLTAANRKNMEERVWRVWGIPSEDPATPPVHSTGGALDITFADAAGKEVDMGSPIDENSNRSNPDHFANAADTAGKRAHANRCLLNELMLAEGFTRHPTEWWHFDRGTQMWAYVKWQKDPASQATAIYGRADLLK
jgi:D-alanyl-D-alanine dipeptidase